MARSFKSLLGDSSGSVAVEFALIGPVLIGGMLAVLQFGLGMQNYNALRSISADTARYAAVNLQKKSTIDNAAIKQFATTTAAAPPYGLNGNRLTVACTDDTTQNITGATRKTLTLDYKIPSMLAMFKINEIPLTYSRPIIVINN